MATYCGGKRHKLPYRVTSRRFPGLLRSSYVRQSAFHLAYARTGRKIMSGAFPDEDETRERLAVIRAFRGSPQRRTMTEALRKAERDEAHRIHASRSGRKTPENSSSFFGHAWPFWFDMRTSAYEHIAESARQRLRTRYSDLWSAVLKSLGEGVGDPWRQLPVLLGYVSDEYHEAVGAIPTAIVVYDLEDEHPGPGFFRLAASYGLLPDEDAPPLGEDWVEMTNVQGEFWVSQEHKVFSYFAQ